METESSAAPSKRPRPLILALLGLLVAVLVVMRFTGSTAPAPAASNQQRAPVPAQSRGDADVDPARLDVRLESLEGERPGPGDSERNPFGFRARAERPAAGPAAGPARPAPAVDGPSGPPPPPAPPPITVKFLGTIELPSGTVVAVLTDCSVGHRTIHAQEGQAVLGQYRRMLPPAASGRTMR
jgi:hypothetical protein